MSEDTPPEVAAASNSDGQKKKKHHSSKDKNGSKKKSHSKKTEDGEEASSPKHHEKKHREKKEGDGSPSSKHKHKSSKEKKESSSSALGATPNENTTGAAEEPGSTPSKKKHSSHSKHKKSSTPSPEETTATVEESSGPLGSPPALAPASVSVNETDEVADAVVPTEGETIGDVHPSIPMALHVQEDTVIGLYGEYEELDPSILKKQQQNEFPEYDMFSMRGKGKNRKKLAMARVRRTNLRKRELLSQMQLNSVPEPKGSLACNPIPGARLGATVNVIDLLRPSTVSWSDRAYCNCQNCTLNTQAEFQADQAFLDTGIVQQVQLQYCVKMLPPQACALVKRKVRPIKPKGVDYVSPLKKAIGGVGFNDIFNAAPSSISSFNTQTSNAPLSKSSSSTVDTADPEVAKYEAELREVQLKILSMLGSGDWKAEVVVIGSSFQPFRHMYLESARIERYLEIKGVDFFTIDVNIDIGKDSPDYALIRRWNEQGLLLRDPRKTNSENPVLVPQVYIDGVPVGNSRDLMELNDDNDLDYILAREACPNCLCDRHADCLVCARCGARYVELISAKFVGHKLMKDLFVKNELNNARVTSPQPDCFERRRRRLGLHHLDEDLTTWFIPERMHRLGCPSLGFLLEME